MRTLAFSALVVFAFAGLRLASPAQAQESSPGAVSPTNQDADNRPNLHSMQSIGEAPGDAAPPGVNARSSNPAPTPPSASAKPPASADSTATAGGAPPQSLAARQQARDCARQASALKGVSAGERDGYVKTCTADANTSATLPGANATRSAPAGATGICKDGSYTATTRRADACINHGGLSHWI